MTQGDVRPERDSVETPVTISSLPEAYKPTLQAQSLALAVSMAGTVDGHAHLQSLVQAAAAQNPDGGILNNQIVKDEFIKWVEKTATGGASLFGQIPVLGVALQSLADGIIHSPQAETFLHTQLDVVISTVYATMKHHGFFAKLLNWIGVR